ncbi:MAG: hypothetical protein WCA81_20025 [Rhizomicrobium sp.]
MTSEKQPNFTGIWRMNLAKSIMHGDAPAEVVMNIVHDEPTLLQHVMYRRKDGNEDRLTFTYKIGAEVMNALRGMPMLTLARWQETELIIEGVVRTPGKDLRFSDHWSLSDNRATLTMSHPDDDLAGQISVLERVSSADQSA